MRRPRFRLRTLMIAVAVFGVIIACGMDLNRRLQRRWSRIPEYRARAGNHADALRAHLIAIREPSHTATSAELAELNRKRTTYHTSLKRQYEQRCRFPGPGCLRIRPTRCL